ncbi:reverse transcriptase domain-containing protein, partial [Actinobacillus pleuropneumoniae]
MALQGKKSSRWKCGETQGQFFGQWFSQVDGISYEETFSPVARYSSIISILALSMLMGWKIHHM